MAARTIRGKACAVNATACIMRRMADFEIERIPLTVRFAETTGARETYGFQGSSGFVILDGSLLRPRGKASDTVAVFMHPTTSLVHLPMPNALVRAGLHVMCCDSRYPRNDSALIMEKVAIDLGAWIRHAREVLHYKKVVLAGWSGGGSLSLFYQAEAEDPTITTTPAGDPADLKAAKLLPADAVMVIAAHCSRAQTLTEWLDPSVKDELNPDDREVELDIYDPRNPNKPPFTPEYIARFRAAQLARSRKITGWVKDRLAAIKAGKVAENERAFVVHRTMADPRWIDPSLEPSDRKPNWCYLGEPKTANTAAIGLGRFNTLRGWLSQWSYDDSRADGPRSAARFKAPYMLIENSADDACAPSHAAALFESNKYPGKQKFVIKGATHYYLNQPDKLAEAAKICTDWLAQRGFLS